MTASNNLSIWILDSNNLDTSINNVCKDCWIEANRLTCLKKYWKEPIEKCFTVSTYRMWICDFCKNHKFITSCRDFFYPDFGLLPSKQELTNMKLMDLYKCDTMEEVELESDFRIKRQINRFKINTKWNNVQDYLLAYWVI